MVTVICPGFHDRTLTDEFLAGLAADWREPPLVFPAERSSPVSAIALWQFLDANISDRRGIPLILIGFSAGVVGAIAVSALWQQSGGRVKGAIAVDGWGVPLAGNFPAYRVSHDRFTHDSSQLLGGGNESFYADPGVEHLDLWRSPQTASGWWLRETETGLKTAIPTTADRAIVEMLKQFGELND